MKRIILVFLLFTFCSIVNAAPIKKIIFLGDSLSDNGNLYKLLIDLVPKSPPYYQGRFSNGPTWAEHVGKYYYDKSYVDYKIYAVGGATTIFHMPKINFIAPSLLELELDKYLIDSLFQDKSNVLFSIWIGANDYLFDQQTEVDKVVNKIASTIKILIQNGAKNFLVLNLPDLSKTPFAQNINQLPKLQMLSQLHNLKLSAAVDYLKSKNPDVKITFVNIYDLFNDVIDNPDKYNQKYHVNITDTKEACWKGGYLLKNMVTQEVLIDDLKRSAINRKADEVKNIDMQAMSNFIFGSPAITYAYEMGKLYERGIVPCANANEHLFWDDMHPTAVVHQVLSQIVIENITNTPGLTLG